MICEQVELHGGQVLFGLSELLSGSPPHPLAIYAASASSAVRLDHVAHALGKRASKRVVWIRAQRDAERIIAACRALSGVSSVSAQVEV